MTSIIELAKVENLNPFQSGETTEGYWASGSVTTCAYSIKIISGKADIQSRAETNWEAGTASGGKQLHTITGENCVFLSRQYANGSENVSYFIIGDGGKEWLDFNAISDKTRANLYALAQEGITVRNVTREELAKLPIDWLELLDGCRGIKSLQGGYYTGKAAHIEKCNNYITVTATLCGSSCVAMTGWTYESPMAQFFIDGRNNTDAYIAYCKRTRYKEKLENLLQDGLSKEQATLYLRAKAQWKHENPAKWCFEMVEKQPYKNVWLAIANASGKYQGNKIAEMYGLTSWYDLGSFPRNSDAAALIAQLCTDETPLNRVAKHKPSKKRNFPTEGDGWKVINGK